MLATSRSASSWSAFRSRTSSIGSSLDEGRGIQDQRRRAVREDRGAAERAAAFPSGRRTARPRFPAVPSARPPPRAERRSPTSSTSPGRRGGTVAARPPRAGRGRCTVGITRSRSTSASRPFTSVAAAAVELDRLGHVGERQQRSARRPPWPSSTRTMASVSGSRRVNVVPCARRARDLHRPAERPHPRQHHVDPDAAARHAAHRAPPC